MKISVTFSPEEGLESFEEEASDILIVYRKEVPMTNTKTGTMTMWPQTFARSVNGGGILEIAKEAMLWCINKSWQFPKQ